MSRELSYYIFKGHVTVTVRERELIVWEDMEVLPMVRIARKSFCVCVWEVKLEQSASPTQAMSKYSQI